MKVLVLSLMLICCAGHLNAKEQSVWSKIQEVYQQTTQKIKLHTDFIKFYWGHEFKTKVQPKIISGYSLYYEHIGSDVSDKLYNYYLKISPELNNTLTSTVDYYKINHPITFRYLYDIPAFLKVAYEKFIFQIWKGLDLIKGHEAVGEHKQALGIAEAAVKAIKSNKYHKESRYLNDLLDDIKYSSFDYGMQDCYKAYVVELDFVNAFNTGCSVFVTLSLMDMFKDDPDALRAVLAHEIAHGDRGHSLKTMGQFVKSGSQHAGQFSLEWMLWLVTGDKHEFYKQVDKEQHLNMIMKEFSQKAPSIELDADVVGAQILERAGYSRSDLKRALIMLHGTNEHSIVCDQDTLRGSSRDYPSLCRRLDAISN